VQYSNLTDDELWRAIAENTDVMSALVHQQFELDAGFGAPIDPDSRAKLMRSNAQKIDKHQREYRDIKAELRRRYPSLKANTHHAADERRDIRHVFG
jgi:hypothetical protein